MSWRTKGSIHLTTCNECLELWATARKQAASSGNDSASSLFKVWIEKIKVHVNGNIYERVYE